MKYSIVIPTFNKCEKFLKPCIDSIIKYTEMTDVELVISANGCTDNTRAYLDYLKTAIPNLEVVWNDEAIGYPKAINEGVKVCTSDKIVLLNNDTVLLEQGKGTWLRLLDQQFQNPKCGISCVMKKHSDQTNRDFAIFFCVMIDRKVFDRIGLLNEEYGVGGCDDMEFCLEAENAGFEVLEAVSKRWVGNQYTGDFPIYHVAEGTMDTIKDWSSIFFKNELRLARKYNLDWYRWRLSNNYERAVFLKNDPVFPRETTRYQWAAENVYGIDILEIGCSTGYGSQFLPNKNYFGLDYDPIIIDVAKEQKWGLDRKFEQADINTYRLNYYDTIIAFEVIEHLDNGLEIVKKLQQHCYRLLITVPWNEPKGFWGEHHKLHGLNESNFPDFQFAYISEAGVVTKEPQEINENNRCNLMLCRWDR